MEARLSLRLQYLPCRASTVSGVCLTASTVTVTSWMLQIKPSPSLLQGSKVELHPLAHAQFATFNSVQRLSPKKGASDAVGEFLSDAPFFGLSLWTELKVANCACASGWSSTFEP